MICSDDTWRQFRGDAAAACGGYPARVRERAPLVHLLTNYVTVTDCVNAVLAIGGRAICSHAPEEAAQVTSGADALVCNLGGTEYYDAMELSAAAAFEKGIPLVIDPVGCSASAHRRDMCLKLVREYVRWVRNDDRRIPAPAGTPAEQAANERKPGEDRPFCHLAIRGNYAEITALLDGHCMSPGLDSVGNLCMREELSLEQRMTAFARENGVILIASGGTDLCTDGQGLREVSRGTPALRRITGAGCLSSAVLAAFLAEEPSLDAAAAAVSLVGIAGEAALAAAQETNTGAGHFHMFLMDFLSAGDPVWEMPR